jgi:MYXO-CTERM domain-containing protein
MSADVEVKFAPAQAGKVPDGTLTITSDDRMTGMSTVILLGNGKDRRVQMAPSTIDLGDTGAGVPTRLSDVKPDGLLSIANLDDANTFQIREIVLDGDNVFEVQDLDGNSVSNAPLAPSSTASYDIVFTPPTVGEFHANATLYLDQDPSAQTSIPVRGRALFVDAHGSGGCSTGGGSGSGMIVVLVGLVLGWRRRRFAGAVAVVLCAPAAASAKPTRNIDLTVFDPTPTTSGSAFQLQTANVGANGEYVATAFASYASGPLVLGTIQADDGVVRNRTMMSIGGAYAFLDKFEAGARMPFYVQSGDQLAVGMFGVPPASGAARGDLTLHAKARLMRRAKLALGAGLSVQLPTASDGEFAGPDKPSARALALVTFTPSSRLTIHVNAGGVIRAKATFANIEQKSGLAWGAGVSLRIRDPLFFAFEVFGDVVPGGYHAAPDPGAMTGATSTLATIEGMLGARYQASRQFSVGLGAGRGLTNSLGTPELRGVIMFAYAPSAPRLAPLHHIEPVLPIDPNDIDSDVDRVSDAKDKCPKVPEDRDGFEDDDGCPDLDNDKDGVPDVKDKCPNVAEDKDGFEDDDGCPDLDNDKDGIPDATDKCPIQPETINGNTDDDGCPDNGDALVISAPDRLELLEPIAFAPNGSITKKSANVLGQLAATLRARTDIVKFRITTHVQPTSAPDKDQAVSDKRAEAVRIWLINWGIAESRIEVHGFGGSKPLVPAASKGSASINDRIELIIVERK